MRTLPSRYDFSFSTDLTNIYAFDNATSITSTLRCNIPRNYWTSEIRVWRSDGTKTIYVPKGGQFELSYEQGRLTTVTITGGNQEYPHYQEGYTSSRVLMLGLELDTISPKTGQPLLRSANWYAYKYYPQGEPIPTADLFDIYEITL